MKPCILAFNQSLHNLVRREKMIKKYVLLLLLPIVMLGMLSSCSNDENKKLRAKVDELQAQVDAYKAERSETAKNLKTFDDLDHKVKNVMQTLDNYSPIILTKTLFGLFPSNSP